MPLHDVATLPQGAQFKRHIEATLGSGNIMEAIKAPPGEDGKEWLAVNTVDFYNAVSMLYRCDPQTACSRGVTASLLIGCGSQLVQGV